MTLERFQYYASQKALKQGIQEGIEQGIVQGIEQGQQKAKESAAIEFLKMGLPIEKVSKGTNLPIDQVELLAKKIALTTKQ